MTLITKIEQRNVELEYGQATTSTRSTAGQLPMEFCADTVIHGGHFTISVNTLNQSPTTSPLMSHMKTNGKGSGSRL